MNFILIADSRERKGQFVNGNLPQLIINLINWRNI